MKYIVKPPEPACLANFRNNSRSPTFDNFKRNSQNRNILKTALLEEQGYICAYTMMRIEVGNSNNEMCIDHLLPQRHHPSHILNYDNMLACYKENGQSLTFGEAQKGDYDPSQNPFVSPLDINCESAFKYNEDGTIEGKTPFAIATIKVLKLDAKELNNLRLNALQGERLVFTLEENPFGDLLTRQEKDNLVQQAYNKLNNKYTPFCVAIQQVAARKF